MRKLFKIIIGIIIFLVVLGVGVGSLVISAGKDAEAIQNDNILFLIVDETNENEVEFGFGFSAGRMDDGPRMIDIKTEVQGQALENMFQSGSLETNCNSLLNQEISMLDISESGARTDTKEKFQRVSLIPTSFFGKLFAMVSEGGMDVQLGDEGDDMQITRHLTSEEALDMLRREELPGTGKWNLAGVTPATGEEMTREIGDEELMTYVQQNPVINSEEYAMAMIKMMIFGSVMDSSDKKSGTGPSSEDKAPAHVLLFIEEFKNGNIKVCPDSGLTRIAKIVPMSLINTMGEGGE